METGSVKYAVVTISDRAAEGTYEDKSGPAIVKWLHVNLKAENTVVSKLISDDQAEIQESLLQLCDDGCSLIFTTGGTGIGSRDCTPNVTLEIADYEVPGIGEVMRAASLLEGVSSAVLSRATGAVRGRTLIVNLPGSPKAIETCLHAVSSTALAHAVAQLTGDAH